MAAPSSPLLVWLLLGVPLLGTSEGAGTPSPAEATPTELEAFRVEESALLTPDSLSPVGGKLRSGFGELDLIEIPRSVSLLTPEAMRAFGIEGNDDLARYGAGTARINYFGIAGTPVLRGVKAGTYFNGMLRAYQRNEMPTSYGSTESLELVKGPAPAQLTPTLVGGYVNQLPKAPYFDAARGSVELQAGSWDFYRAQADYGAPFLLGAKPAAYRVSLTAQDADSYYDHIRDDLISLYAAGKVKLNDRLRLSLGGEFYDYRSSENPGFNRPTQQLVDSGRYVIGEPALATGAGWGGTVVRPTVVTSGPSGASVGLNPGLKALAIPGDIARARISDDLRARMIDLNDPAQVAALYTVNPNASAADQARAQAALAQMNPTTQDAYVYTPAYFAAGGTALTEKLDRKRILSDPDDYADARDWLGFVDLEGQGAEGLEWKNQAFVEVLDTDKYSTYGFASQSSQVVVADRASVLIPVEPAEARWLLGLDTRAAFAEMRQDFGAEPFSRRDLSRDGISGNSQVWVGDDRSPVDGLNLWTANASAGQASDLYEVAAFTSVEARPTERLLVLQSLRLGYYFYDTRPPTGVDRYSPATRAALTNSGSVPQVNYAFSPVYTLLPGLNAYGTAQLGKAVSYADGGAVKGEVSFTDTELFELGLKSVLLEDRLYQTLAIYRWEQSTWSQIDAVSLPLRGRGLEYETTYTPLPGLAFIGAFTAQRVELERTSFGFGGVPQSEQDWALNGGVFNTSSERSTAANPDRVYAGYPELTASLLVSYQHPCGLGGALGPQWNQGYWHDITRTIAIPDTWLWRASLFYELRSWEFRLTVENLFGRDYWVAQEPIFAAGTLITPGEPRSFRAGVKYKF